MAEDKTSKLARPFHLVCIGHVATIRCPHAYASEGPPPPNVAFVAYTLAPPHTYVHPCLHLGLSTHTSIFANQFRARDGTAARL